MNSVMEGYDLSPVELTTLGNAAEALSGVCRAEPNLASVTVLFHWRGGLGDSCVDSLSWTANGPPSLQEVGYHTAMLRLLSRLFNHHGRLASMAAESMAGQLASIQKEHQRAVQTTTSPQPAGTDTERT